MLFQKTIVKKYLNALPKEDTSTAWQRYRDYFLNKDIQQNIQQSKEEQFQEGFLRELFVKVLGYTLNPSPDYNLITEQKNETNSKKADGAILLDDNVVGVIELKDHKTTDLSKVETQAFNYKNKHRGTRLVVISNFEKLRLYIDNAVEYREWDLFTLSEDEFRELYLCLAWPQVKRGTALQMKSDSVSSEDQITNALYRDYSQFKRALFADILKNNPAAEDEDVKDWQLLLFKKTQKLLDRLLFIFFAEDCGLLPPNSMVQIIDQWEQLKEMDEYRPFYDRVKKYFGYMNTGFKGKKYEIFAYNGGLFKPDEVLDNIKISDDLLAEHCRKLSDYDFESDVDVNILGHIFENSLSEIEEVTQQIQSASAPLPMGERLGEKLSKRKQDGVFYTPQYITKYIVENTVGRLCAEKKQQFGIVEEEYFSDQRRQMQTKKRLLDQLQQYRDWLLQITILDPACGSGAFLNAALQFLMKEHKLIDEMEAKVSGASIEFQGVENSILENNLYGVDINEESVEIAQLALWLRTAKPHRKLNSLNQNIKCGNSLISDPAIAGDKAFNWQEQFPQVFRRKEKHAYHIVTATHDSRTSQRMVEKQVRELRYHGTMPEPDPVTLSEEEELLVCRVIDDIAREDGLDILAFNICRDHFHMLLVCEEKEVANIVGKIKSKTAIAVNKARGLAPLSTNDNGTMGEDKGASPLASTNDNGTMSEDKGASPLASTNDNGTMSEDKGASPLASTNDNGTMSEDKGASPLASTNDNGTMSEDKGASPLASGAKRHSRPIWTQKFGCSELATNEHLMQTMQYIGNNRIKHQLPPLPIRSNGASSIAFPLACIVDYDTAFRTEYEGGFDVVIGNPPYVHLESILDTSNQLQKAGYWTYNKRGDLYCLFVEKGFQLSKPNGIVSYIMPNKWLQAGYGKELRAYFLSKRLERLIDFGDIQIFEGATTYPCIFIGRNSEPAKQMCVSVLKAADAQDFNQNVKNTEEVFDLSQFTSDTWVISSQKEKAMLERLSSCHQTLRDFIGGEAYRGVLTGLSEAFLIDANTYQRIVSKDERAKERIFPFLQGRNITPYGKPEAVSYLILFEKGWTQREQTFDNEADAWNYLKAEYPSIAEWLEPFAEKGRKRTDKGDFWWELRACDYYNQFAKPKIMYQKFQVKSCFVYDEKGYYCNDSMWFIPTECKALLTIFNSRMGWWLITKFCSQIQNGHQLIWKYFGRIPIPNTSEDDTLFVLADTMLSLNKQLQAKRSRFLRRLTENLSKGACPLVKITTALQTFDQLDFAAFVAELKKQKIKLSLAQQDEWEDYFNQYRNDCQQLSEQIAQTDREIDQLVYQLYGLTEDEINVVESM